MVAKTGCGRPIGKSVVRAMEILERLGEANYTEVWLHMQDVGPCFDSSKYLRRSVEYGLAERLEGRPARYRPVSGWRDILAAPVQPTGRLSTMPMRRVASVWDLANSDNARRAA